jgi:hypothetical protein
MKEITKSKHVLFDLLVTENTSLFKLTTAKAEAKIKEGMKYVTETYLNSV